jgi:hypothetical protein
MPAICSFVGDQKYEIMLPFTDHVDGYFDVQDQMAHQLRNLGEQFLQRQTAQKAGMTLAEFEARRRRVRKHFLSAIGGLPAERTPLCPVYRHAGAEWLYHREDHL